MTVLLTMRSALKGGHYVRLVGCRGVPRDFHFGRQGWAPLYTKARRVHTERPRAHPTRSSTRTLARRVVPDRLGKGGPARRSESTLRCAAERVCGTTGLAVHARPG